MSTAITLSGCLITQPVHFDPPANSPPAIYDSPTAALPISQIVRLDTLSSGDAGVGAGSIMFELVVADPDVDQTLHRIVEIDGNVATDLPAAIPASAALMGRDRRTVQFSLPTAQFLVTPLRCHRVDFFVSGQFSGVRHLPLEQNDLAQATWWIQPDPSVEMGMCP